MSENKEVYKIDASVKEVVIAHKKALDEKEPVKLNFSGTIESVFEFIQKRGVVSSAVNRAQLLNADINASDNIVICEEAHVIIDRDEMSIELILNESDPLRKGSVKGRLVLSDDYKKWEINTGEGWSHLKLAEFIKMNRYCFEDKNTAMKLSAELSDIKVKADAAYERSQDQKGNTRFLVSKSIIQSNIPGAFTINVPMFKGMPSESIEVEVYVDASSYSVTLNSPEANEIINRYKERIFDEQKKNISDCIPMMPILEK